MVVNLVTKQLNAYLKLLKKINLDMSTTIAPGVRVGLLLKRKQKYKDICHDTAIRQICTEEIHGVYVNSTLKHHK